MNYRDSSLKPVFSHLKLWFKIRLIDIETSNDATNVANIGKNPRKNIIKITYK